MTSADADSDLAIRYPHLFRREKWKWAAAHVTFSTALPDDALVTNVHIAGFVGDDLVVCRTAKNDWFLPGGSREKGETVEQCAARELLEEAGARLVSPLRLFGAHYVASYQDHPTRPGNPHPLRAILWCTADLVVDALPTNPPDGEQVLEVRTVPVPEAQRLLRADGKWTPELAALATELHRPAAR
jgi:8-oxo-dGTP diphosphatase